MIRFLDTNILLYSISTDRDEKAKREVATELLAGRDNALSVQVLQEFYVQATRSTRRDALPHEIAVGLMRAWLRFPVQDITLAVLSDALEIKVASGLSYWDAAIVSAARALVCRELFSEDMSHGRVIEGVAIVNPFR
jgi:predicted nucleic acid-binding protein